MSRLCRRRRFLSSNRNNSSMDGSLFDAKICLGRAVDAAAAVVVVVLLVVVVEVEVDGAIKITHARQFSIT